MSIPEIKVTVQGIGPLQAMMLVAPQIVLDEEVKAMRKATLTVEGQAKRGAPVDTGNLRRSIHSEVRTLLTGVTGLVGTPVSYAPYPEFGTGLYGPKQQRIYPKNGRFLAWKVKTTQLDLSGKKIGTGEAWMVAQSVAGMKPRPYMRPAFQSKLRDVEGYFKQALQNVLRRLASRA